MTSSETDIVTMSFPKFGIEIDKWISYSANSHFTTPSDGFEFVVAKSSLDDVTLSALKNGELFQIRLNGHTQAEGYIDRITTQSNRGSGTVLRIEGCDRLAQVVRAGVDPRTRFRDGQTLLDVLVTVFQPFGYTIDDFLASNDTNRNTRTGQVRGPAVSKKGKPLKSFVLHQTKPYPGEGAFAFASRLAQRFGLWIWLSAEGNVVIVSTPDFDRPHSYSLARAVDGVSSNIIDGSAREDYSGQPSCVVATGFSYGGEPDRSRLKVILLNGLVSVDATGFPTANVQAIIDANKDAKIAQMQAFQGVKAHPHPAAQPMYIHDQESQTLEQLERFARRELALRQKEALHVTYVVEGHGQQSLEAAEPTIWCVDTICRVDDDLLDIHEDLWVMSRTFEKSRDSGTRTVLELIRPRTLIF